MSCLWVHCWIQPAQPFDCRMQSSCCNTHRTARSSKTQSCHKVIDLECYTQRGRRLQFTFWISKIRFKLIRVLHLSVSRKWLELGLELLKLDAESAVSDSGQVADTAVLLQANQIREFRRFFPVRIGTLSVLTCVFSSFVYFRKWVLSEFWVSSNWKVCALIERVVTCG